MNGQSQTPQPGGQNVKAEMSIKAVAIDLFKKSQRLPPLSRILKKKKGQSQLLRPPLGFDFADFYHL
jgi:hypothetical protein